MLSDNRAPHGTGRDAAAAAGGSVSGVNHGNLRDVGELIRRSDDLRLRSLTVQLAATRAGLFFRYAVQRSIEAYRK